MRLSAILFVQGLAAFCALAAALVFQYAVHLPPCHFCLLQRYPYFAVVVGSLLALVSARWLGHGQLAVAWGNAVLFAVSAGLAAWHSGVERGWWTSGSGCTSPVGGDTPEALLAALLAAPVVRCDEIPWDILGLSLANLNVIYGAAAAGVSLWLLRRNTKA
jgi:disulfide bond formation protein DsbB